jgi:hypothetical protein
MCKGSSTIRSLCSVMALCVFLEACGGSDGNNNPSGPTPPSSSSSPPPNSLDLDHPVVAAKLASVMRANLDLGIGGWNPYVNYGPSASSTSGCTTLVITNPDGVPSVGDTRLFTGRDCGETFTEGSTTRSFERLFSVTAFNPASQDVWQATQGLSGPGQMTWRIVVAGINYAGSSTFTQTSSVTFEQMGSSQSQRGSQRAVSTGTENGVPFSFTVDSQWTCNIGPVGSGPTTCVGASGAFSGQLGLGISASTTATLTQTGSSPLTFAITMDGKTATLTENVGFTVRAASGQELTLSNAGLFGLRAY